MFDPPERATRHCRFYSYELGGPCCAGGILLTGPGDAMKCMPPVAQQGATCDFREEYTDAERAAWDAWCTTRAARMLIVLAQIPGSSTDRKNMPEWGNQGEIDCPGCLVGKVRWLRARSNGHLRAVCSTPNCFSVIE
jgi:hypothetical protein